ncbi:MAG: hypothetical protein KJ623_00910 [Nanoarchaeota archaeon]|nr:hypothetical protein [Nanoarchaeota archaeon]MBU0962593.1 hypothetical protein [Nanoarchaeota archaeon]
MEKNTLKAKKQEIRYFVDKLKKEELLVIAEKNKNNAFGFFSGISDKFSKEKAEIKLLKIYKRYDPFWHIIAESLVDYERKSKYKVIVDKQVKKLRIGETEFNAEEGKQHNDIVIHSTDICHEHRRKEILIDGAFDIKTPTNIKNQEKLAVYLHNDSKKIKEVEELMKNDVIVVPVVLKAAFILRSMLQDIINPVSADKILNEKVGIDELILYFKPVYIFEYTHSKKNEKKYVEVDSINGRVKILREMEHKRSKELFTESALFDIGVSALSSLVPGGEAAYKLVRGIREERKRNKNKA